MVLQHWLLSARFYHHLGTLQTTKLTIQFGFTKCLVATSCFILKAFVYILYSSLAPVCFAVLFLVLIFTIFVFFRKTNWNVTDLKHSTCVIMSKTTKMNEKHKLTAVWNNSYFTAASPKRWLKWFPYNFWHPACDAKSHFLLPWMKIKAIDCKSLSFWCVWNPSP